ncbi:hypothetical protein SAMN03159423_4927 [Bradyrhizobium sp. NFR13]|uniref:hypothetical protein n=1 Tax=Bradyrhizobium sp. NFR13 TaxID=1566285 RepID=UPI0008DFD468|nr:hypothetical protein [Bradyrhizobium sp. NFR13]SFM03050.1 hypothetical protein SAMN03159423_4927 [Bradyrhizobium sp. NFR13]
MSERKDIDHRIKGVEEARTVLSWYLKPGPRNAADTVARLIDILDDRDFVATLDRLNRRKVIRLVE